MAFENIMYKHIVERAENVISLIEFYVEKKTLSLLSESFSSE
jgi:hypothetical protein